MTVRERQLVGLALAGLDTRQIAGRLFISDYTVKDHLKSVFAKMGIHSRRELLGNLFGADV
ncbi:helix-turn-helix domain-containing protein [Sinomonas sp. RB5]